MSHQAAAAGWNNHAAIYARMFAPLTSYVARAMVQVVDTRLPPGAQILDIACGAGAVALCAVERAQRELVLSGATGRITATDFSSTMVALTQQAGTAIGATAELLRCEVQNGEALSYADAAFDAAFSSFGIFLFTDRAAGWREAARVLRPGGWLVTSVWQGPMHNPMMRAQLAPVMQALPAHLQPTNTKGSWLEIATAETLIDEVTAAAPLVDARCYPFQATFTISNGPLLWEAMQNNPLMGALLRRCNPAELDVVRTSVLRHFATLAGGDGLPVLLESVCNILVARRE
ncbi:MAG: methyltransferase domain-containing protein [Kofleriaceae bacterium]|nr:methyltransferase domain-containing protein [Kofleriaceae bacterium]